MGREGYMARYLFVHSSHPGRASTRAEGRKKVESLPNKITNVDHSLWRVLGSQAKGISMP